MVSSLRVEHNLTTKENTPKPHLNFQASPSDRPKSLNWNQKSDHGAIPTVRDRTSLNSPIYQASPKPFLISGYTNLYLKRWQPKPRFSDHHPEIRLALFGLAAAFGSHRPDTALTVNLRVGETTAGFINKLAQAVRRAGGRKLTYFGVAASLPWQHLHLALSLSSGSAEREAVQKFLCRRGDVSAFDLWRRGGAAEPRKPVHLAPLTDALPGYNSVPGFTRYLAHHIRDAERSDYPEQYAIEIVASEELRALAREIGNHPPEKFGEVIKREDLDLPGLLEIHGPMLARVISQRNPKLPLNKAIRRVLEGYIDHIRANRIPVVQPPPTPAAQDAARVSFWLTESLGGCGRWGDSF